MTPVYHWAGWRIEAHVKICVLALLIECSAELACGKPWQQIRGALEKLQVKEFFNLNHRVLMCNELPADTRKMLKLLKITPPQQVVYL
jgi:transposase